jgi:glutamine synthetase
METIDTGLATRTELRESVLRQAGEAEVKFIRLWFTDVVGRLKSFSITREELEAALDHGMGFDGSSVTGFNAIEESDMIAMPDPATYRLLPRQAGERAVARMFCDIRTPDGDPYQADSRHVLRNALERMRSMGFDSFKIGPELEYFYFRMDDEGRPHPLDAGGYFEDTTMDAAYELRKQTVLALEEMGIPVEYLHHEVGPSQHEIDVRYSDALEMADHCMTYRSVV